MPLFLFHLVVNTVTRDAGVIDENGHRIFFNLGDTLLAGSIIGDVEFVLLRLYVSNT